MLQKKKHGLHFIFVLIRCPYYKVRLVMVNCMQLCIIYSFVNLVKTLLT